MARLATAVPYLQECIHVQPFGFVRVKVFVFGPRIPSGQKHVIMAMKRGNDVVLTIWLSPAYPTHLDDFPERCRP